MLTVVITGSTRGLGFGLAAAFLDLDCQVAVSGRNQASVDRAVANLTETYAPDRIWGAPCDVTQFNQVQMLWDGALTRFGAVDIWINNAGIGSSTLPFWGQPPDTVRAIVETNLIGAMNGARVALPGMLAQGSGSLYNMEGFGSDGRKMTGLAIYGSTKYGLRYFTDALVKETRDKDILVGALSPGMVVTDLLLAPYANRPEDLERAKRIFNILADRVETVAPWLAQKVLANRKHGARIKWLTQRKIMARFLSTPFRRRDLFV